MFCGFQPSNLSVPENIEDIKQKWNKRVLTYCITNLTPKLTEEYRYTNKLILLLKFGINLQNSNLRKYSQMSPVT